MSDADTGDSAELDREIEIYTNLCRNFKLPSYLPIDRSTRNSLNKVKNLDDGRLAEKLKKELASFTDEYLLFSLPLSEKYSINTQDVLDAAFQSLETLENIDKDQAKLNEAKGYIASHAQNRMESEPQFNYENLQFYLDKNDTPPSLEEMFLERMNAPSNPIATDRDVLRLKQHVFVIQHPQEPLPGELSGNHDDDDIEVAGGKIELVCPISRKPFVDPYIAPCGHTFSKASLEEISRSSTVCPISGCQGDISIRRCKKDELMELRVKSYEVTKAMEEKKRRKNIETIE